MSNPPLSIRQCAYLPHWTREGAIYAVTFRLADSLPKSVVESWEFERQDIVKTARQMNRPLTPPEEARLDRLFSDRVEKYLDAGAGECWMQRTPTNRAFVEILYGESSKPADWKDGPVLAARALRPFDSG